MDLLYCANISKIFAISINLKNARDNGMTLIDKQIIIIDVPGWKKSENFLDKHQNVIIESGADGTGNLYNPENFNYCVENYPILWI